MRERTFKYFACGHRHLNRNKTRRNLAYKRKHRYILTPGDHGKAKRMLPYFRKSKFLKS